jgi:ATP synthase protein I
MLRLQSKPIRTVFRWQVTATAALTLVAGFLAGVHGALSAALGGLVSIFAGLGFVLVASMGKSAPGRSGSAGEAILAALRAEAVKIGLIVVLLLLVLTTYPDVVVLAFIGSFILTVLIFTLAFFVRDY